eukprot:COSAG01_NODE_5121_length_4471_cov_8.084629_6_plen_96_part_00
MPFIQDFAKDNPVVGSFLVGWISALQKHRRAQDQDQTGAVPLFLDGTEAYGASTVDDIITMKNWVKQGMAGTNIVPPALRHDYPLLETVSHGVYE